MRRFKALPLVAVLVVSLLVASDASAAKPKKRQAQELPTVVAPEPGVFVEQTPTPSRAGVPFPSRAPGNYFVPATTTLAGAVEPIGVPLPQLRNGLLPLGQWSRDLGPLKEQLTVAPNSLKARVEIIEGKDRFIVHLAADFSITGDGLVYGVLSDVHLEETMVAAGSEDRIVQFAEIQNQLIDEPFSFRWRIVDDALVIKDVKFAGGGLTDDGEFGKIASFHLAGRYERAKTHTNVVP